MREPSTVSWVVVGADWRSCCFPALLESPASDTSPPCLFLGHEVMVLEVPKSPSFRWILELSFQREKQLGGPGNASGLPDTCCPQYPKDQEGKLGTEYARAYQTGVWCRWKGCLWAHVLLWGLDGLLGLVSLLRGSAYPQGQGGGRCLALVTMGASGHFALVAAVNPSSELSQLHLRDPSTQVN